MICPCQSLSGFSGKVLGRGKALSFWGFFPLCFVPGYGGTAFTGQQGPQRTALYRLFFFCPVMPGKSHGPRSLVGYNSWGRKESDTTERLLCVCVCQLLGHLQEGRLGNLGHHHPGPHPHLQLAALLASTSLRKNSEKCSLTNPLAGSKSFRMASFGNASPPPFCSTTSEVSSWG